MSIHDKDRCSSGIFSQQERNFPASIHFNTGSATLVVEKAMATHSSILLLPGKSHRRRSLVGYSAQHCKESGTTEQIHFHFSLFHALEKEMATHSSILAWRIPWTEDPGGLPSMGLHRVRHDWSDLAAATTIMLSGFNILKSLKLKILFHFQMKIYLF